jgi:hypothetical protein
VNKIGFEFNNQVSPSYLEALLIQLQPGRWYEYSELKRLLQETVNVEGSNIVNHNATAWRLTGIAAGKSYRAGRSNYNAVCLTPVGEQLVATYSTNRELFFDLIHFLFYSTWPRSHDLQRARFWLYVATCDLFWQEAPLTIDSFSLTARLQSAAHQQFPVYKPAFSERSVRGVFPWIAALTPPFLVREGSKGQYRSQRRTFCTPQLFHLAADLVFHRAHLEYGTAVALGDEFVEEICKVCLLDREKFWEMASLTAMVIREFEVRQSQLGRAIVLNGPPAWITLPDFSPLHQDAEAGLGLEDDEPDPGDED